MDLPWLSIVPDAAYGDLRHLRDVAGFKGSFFVSENGCGAVDEFSAEVVSVCAPTTVAARR